MSDSSQNERLNAVLIRLHRCLLQYVEECWPWSGQGQSGERLAVQGLAREQQHFVGGLVDLLSSRGWPIDFGNYPTDFTDLHYVGLDYLLGRIADDEQTLVAFIELARAGSMGDSSATSLLSHLLDAERRHASRLRELAGAVVV